MRLKDKVLYKGMECRIIGITHSHRECEGGYFYQLLPVTAQSLSRAISYVSPKEITAIEEKEEVTYVAGAYGAAMPVYHKPTLAVNNSPKDCA